MSSSSEDALSRTRGPRSRFRQFHSTLELRWLVILGAEIGVIQRSDPFYLIVGELWAFRTRREFGELLFIVNVRERLMRSVDPLATKAKPPGPRFGSTFPGSGVVPLF